MTSQFSLIGSLITLPVSKSQKPLFCSFFKANQAGTIILNQPHCQLTKPVKHKISICQIKHNRDLEKRDLAAAAMELNMEKATKIAIISTFVVFSDF